MRISTNTTFPADPEAVFAVVADPAFQSDKAASGTLPGSSATVAHEGGGLRVTTVRVLSADALPGFARNIVGEQLTIDESQVWGPPAADGSRQGTVDLRVRNVPVTMTGTLTLSASSEGSAQTVEGDLTAKVPFLGGKIESAAAPVLVEAIENEFDLIRARL